METFYAAPAVPSDFHLVSAVLSDDEIKQAQNAGYIRANSNVGDELPRGGIDVLTDEPPVDIDDWRIRMFLIWFMYIFETMDILEKPMGALEEVLWEFKAPDILDLPGRKHLAALYAGAWDFDPLSTSEIERERSFLLPYYQKALHVVAEYAKRRRA